MHNINRRNSSFITFKNICWAHSWIKKDNRWAAYVFKSHNLLTDVADPDQGELKNTTEKLQELAAKFRASINTVPWFPIFAKIKLLPPKKDLLKAAGVLSKISYAPYESDKGKISEQIEELYRLLKFNMYGQ